jgi:hypothetical protein
MRDRPITETSLWTTQNIHNRQTAMRPVGFETAILANERPQTYARPSGPAKTLLKCVILYSNLVVWTVQMYGP